MKIGLAYAPVFLEHRMHAGHHPECPERLVAITQAFAEAKLSDILENLHVKPVDELLFAEVHSEVHVDRIKEEASRAPAMIDGDTYVAHASYEAARMAAGAVVAAVDAVYSGQLTRAFCAVRPPGHHAEKEKAMGFCLFNNVAVGATYARRAYGLQRIAIVDWDVHHGNGTQAIFYEDPSVLFISTHESPLYPGTGQRTEIGNGAGQGYTLNIPMHAGDGDMEMETVFNKQIIPALDQFKPELLFISAGFDAHARDPLANMTVTSEGFGKLTRLVVQAAEKHCQGRVISVLEGGYHLEALGASVVSHIRQLAHE